MAHITVYRDYSLPKIGVLFGGGPYHKVFSFWGSTLWKPLWERFYGLPLGLQKIEALGYMVVRSSCILWLRF